MEEFTFLSNWLLWLIAAAILVIVELLTNTFAAFCLVGGCALALATSLIGFGIEAQLTAAAIGSVLSFIAFKPLIRRQAEARRHRDCLSNMDALIGRTTTVTEAIGGNTPGRVRIDGDNWQRRRVANQRRDKGACVWLRQHHSHRGARRGITS